MQQSISLCVCHVPDPNKKLLKQILVSKHDVSNQRSVLIFCIVIIFQSYHYINMSVISVRKKLVTLRVFNTVLFNLMEAIRIDFIAYFYMPL